MADTMINIWDGNAFQVVSMTAAIQTLPAVPGKITKLGLFTEEGVTTDAVAIDSQDFELSLVPTRPRGTAGTQAGHETRTTRMYKIPHNPIEDVVLADDYNGIREFGSSAVMSGPATLINSRLQRMKDREMCTLEFLRAKALQGVITNINLEGQPEASAAHNLFTDFGVTEQTVDFVFGTTTTKIQQKAVEATRKSEKALGAIAHTGFLALCGRTFWDNFIAHTVVKAAFDRWNEGAFLRDDLRSQGFLFAGISWMEYDASLGTATQGALNEFFPPAECRIFPTGVNNLFITRYAPAPWMETVNTMGQQMYAKQMPMEWDMGRKLRVEMNAINMCLRPATLVKGYSST